MSQAANENEWVIEGRSIADVMAGALHRLVVPNGSAGDADFLFRLVFSGEGGTREEALRAAVDDVREQCLEQRAVPIDIETSGVMATDAGTRIWGTVTVEPGTMGAQSHEGAPRITLREGEGKRWTLTITAE